jgi:N-acylneuraminate cytidylyltransferase
MKTFAFVFARSGSKGVRGKNIRRLCNKPLLNYSLDVASQIVEIERIFVSTNSPEIAAVAESLGATVINRPNELARDDTPEWLAWQHAVKWVHDMFGEFDRFVSLPTTAPLRIKEDVVRCLAALDDSIDIVVTMTPAHRSPWFNMVKIERNKNLSILVNDAVSITRRQNVPTAYDMTTIAYVARPSFILDNKSIWDGRVRGVVIPQERALDIDTEFDFEVAELLMIKRLLQGAPLC